MSCYRLARTVVPYSGQVEWAYTIDSSAVAKLDIKPISEHIPYTPVFDCLRYGHAYAVRELYKNTSKTFWSSIIEPEYRSWQVMLQPKVRQKRDTTYEAGASRVSKEKYGKQFKVFAPCWIDKMPEKYVRIVLHIRNKLESNEKSQDLFRWGLLLGRNGTDPYSKYFYDWMEQICRPAMDGNATPADNFIYFNSLKKTANISGLHVPTGALQVNAANNLVEALLNRELPAMEQNNKFAKLFEQHNMVCSQLFNFAFYFNLEDLGFTGRIDDFTALTMFATLEIDGQEIERSDFLFNYDKLKRQKLNIRSATCAGGTGKFLYEIVQSTEWSENYNVYDYLNDNLYIDYYNKNKLVCTDPYMSLIEFPTMPFTLYDGFSPKISISYTNTGDTDTKEEQDSTGHMGTTPNIIADAATPMNNGYLWCRWYAASIYDLGGLQRLGITKLDQNGTITEVNSISPLLGKMYDLSKPWQHGIKFHPTTYSSNTDADIICVYGVVIYDGTVVDTPQQKNLPTATYNINGINIKNCIFSNDTTICSVITIKPESGGYDVGIKNHIAEIDAVVQKCMSFKHTLSLIGSKVDANNKTSVLTKFYNYCKDFYKPTISFFNKSVAPVEANSEFNEHKRYNKVDSYYKYLIRYDGKLQPFFTTNDTFTNNVYWFKTVKNVSELDSTYKSYLQTKYIPQYIDGPSTSFYPLKRAQVNYTTRNEELPLTFEEKHFEDGVLFATPLMFTTQFEKGNDELLGEIENSFNNYILKDTTLNNDLVSYLRTCYNYKFYIKTENNKEIVVVTFTIK